MNVIYESREALASDHPIGVGLGVFDGIHIGHANLIETLIRECRANSLHSSVYTFAGHPERVLRGRTAPKLITSLSQKISLLERMGLDNLFLAEFNEEFSHMEPEQFVEEKLVKLLRARLVVAGYNYRFGYQGRGDVKLLERLGEAFKFRVIVMEPVKIGDQAVSSTLIRELLAKGEVESAFRFLGRPFSLEGKVVSGKQVGRGIGFPTANLKTEKGLLIPARGVYITRTFYRGSAYMGVTNVGYNPTVSGKDPFLAEEEMEPVQVENHLLDFQGELYGEKMEVSFLKRIRGEICFDSREELSGQIRKDIQTAEDYFRTIRESQG